VLFAPRIAPRLHASLARHARTPLTPAEITRRLGAEAERRGLPRPCYEQVRVLVQRARGAQERQWAVALDLGVALRVGAADVPRIARVATGAVFRPLEFLPRRRR